MRRSTAPTRRRRRLLATSLPVALAVALSPAVPAALAAPTAPITTTVSKTFLASGAWVVPQGVTSVTLTARGGSGGDGGRGYDSIADARRGGLGSTLAGTLAVTPGDVLDITVGKRGGDGEDAQQTAGSPVPGAGGAGLTAGGRGGFGTLSQQNGVGQVEAGGGGGGGSTGVTRGSDTLLEAAGGGGSGGNVAVPGSGGGHLGGAGAPGSLTQAGAQAETVISGSGCAPATGSGPGWGDVDQSDGHQRTSRQAPFAIIAAGGGGGGGGSMSGGGGLPAAPEYVTACYAPGPGGNGGLSRTSATPVLPAAAPAGAVVGDGWVLLTATRTPVTVEVAPIEATVAGVATDVDVTVTTPDGALADGDVVATVGTMTTTTTLVDGRATLQVSAPTTGTHTITVTWRPGTVDAWSMTTSFVVTTSTVQITTDSPHATLPDAADLAVTVTSTTPGRTPTGDVAVVDQTTGAPIGLEPLADGEATVSVDTTDLLPGTSDVTVTYSGDDDHTSRSTISTLTLQGTTTLVPLPSTSVAFGATHDIPGSVIRSHVESPAATGTVTATIPGHAPLTATVVDGEYTLVTPADLAPGSYTVDLDYSGDDLWAGSTTTSTLTVRQGTVTLTLTGPSTVPVGKPSTWTATVERVADDTPTGPVVVSRLAAFATPAVAPSTGTITPTGIVELLVDGEVVDSADLVDGTVDLVAPAATTTGTRAVSARYLGSDGYVALDQSALTTDLTVTPVSTGGGTDGGENGNPGEGTGNNGNGGTGNGTTPDEASPQPSTSPTPDATATATAERGLASTGASGTLPILGITLLAAGAVLVTARTSRLRRN